MSGTHLPVKELLAGDKDHECPGFGPDNVCVHIASIADLPTRFGDFHIVAFWNHEDRKEHVALVRGDVTNAADVLARLHSECLTGDALGSLRCDCRDQLEAALRALGRAERSVLLYLRQEGRGIGLLNKLRAYGLQDYGYDTVEANLALGFRDDEREYAVAAHMLMSLKVRSVRLTCGSPFRLTVARRPSCWPRRYAISAGVKALIGCPPSIDYLKDSARCPDGASAGSRAMSAARTWHTNGMKYGEPLRGCGTGARPPEGAGATDTARGGERARPGADRTTPGYGQHKPA